MLWVAKSDFNRNVVYLLDILEKYKCYIQSLFGYSTVVIRIIQFIVILQHTSALVAQTLCVNNDKTSRIEHRAVELISAIFFGIVEYLYQNDGHLRYIWSIVTHWNDIGNRILLRKFNLFKFVVKYFRPEISCHFIHRVNEQEKIGIRTNRIRDVSGFLFLCLWLFTSLSQNHTESQNYA